MANIYKSISSDTTGSPVTLITKGAGRKGHVNKITIANHHASLKNTVQLHLWNGLAGGDSITHVITEVVIPSKVTLVLTDNLTFDSKIYNLRVTTETSANISIIVN